MLRKIILPLLIIFGVTYIYADPLAPQKFKPLTKQEMAQDKNTGDDLAQKEFYLNINPKDIKDVQNKDKELKETFDKFDEALVNYRPVIKPLSSRDDILIHPYFTSTLLLPAGSVISHVDFSNKVEVLKWQENTILLRPLVNFDIANMVILYALNNKNHVMSIVVKRYERGETDEKLILIHSYQDVRRLEDFEVINLYRKTYGSLPKQQFNYVYVDDILYRIVEDEKFGTLMVSGKKYRVDIGTNYQ